MRWDVPNLRLHQSRLVIPNVLQQRAQTQIILTDNDNHATGEQWRQIFSRTYVIVSVKKIDKKKKWATKSISKCKRNFYLKQWNLLKNKWNQPRKRIFLRTDVIFTHGLHRGRMSFEYFVKTVGPTLQIVFFFNFGFCVGASVSLLLFRTTNIVPTDNEKCNLVSNEKK